MNAYLQSLVIANGKKIKETGETPVELRKDLGKNVYRIPYCLYKPTKSKLKNVSHVGDQV